MNALRLSITCVSLSVLFVLAAADQKKNQPPQRETIARPQSEREKKKSEDRLRKELETPYRRWLNEDVAYIITPEERDAFKRFQTDEEREAFIEQFWLRRDPTPDSVENEFREEHYRRIAYANERFSSGIQGWKTDRGRIYITYGPPDEIEDHSQGGTYQRPMEEGGGSTSVFPFQKWRYRYLEDIGTNIEIEFVDPTMSGEFRMTMDPSEKDALLHVPGAGLTLFEELGLTNKEDRFNRSDGTHLGNIQGQEPERMKTFSRLEQFTKLQKAPAVKFKDLQAVIESRISYSVLPMKVRADFFPITETSVLTTITLQFDDKDLQFSDKTGVPRAELNIQGSITTMARRRADTFEETLAVEIPKQFMTQVADKRSIYQKITPLVPGRYRLNVVAKDVVANTMAAYEMSLDVPRLDPDKLSASSMILADVIEPVPIRSIGSGQFVIGGSKVRPRVGEVFKRQEKLGIFWKLYNFGQDERTRKPLGNVEYEIVRGGGASEKVLEYAEDLTAVEGASAAEVTIEKLLPLNTLAPGQYTLKMKVTDKIRNQVLTGSANFTVL